MNLRTITAGRVVIASVALRSRQSCGVAVIIEEEVGKMSVTAISQIVNVFGICATRADDGTVLGAIIVDPESEGGATSQGVVGTAMINISFSPFINKFVWKKIPFAFLSPSSSFVNFSNC